MANIQVIQSDITTLTVDAIVNAANQTLMGGGGVDGAIHSAAGPDLKRACVPLAPCPAGEVRLTPGFNLPARFVIHTVGPVWRGGQQNEEQLLANCYRNSLALASRELFRHIAFPAISTGAFGFPADRAAAIAVETTHRYLDIHPTALETVYFVCFDAQTQQAYEKQLARLSQR